MSGLQIVAMVPARMGSTRLKMKNLALINGQPMIAYAIRAAQQSGAFQRVVVNSDHPDFKIIADRYGAEFYQRSGPLGSSTTKSDAVVHDFLLHHPCDVVVWVNPIAPLQPAQEIREVVDFFAKSQLDTLMTVQDLKVHCALDGQPLNFSFNGEFAQTQDLKPVQAFVYSLMMWRAIAFLSAMAERECAMFCGKVGYYPVSKLSSVIIKTEEDLLLADALARTLDQGDNRQVCYDPIGLRVDRV